jgi:O-antigen ligase
MSIIAISLVWGFVGFRLDYGGYTQAFHNLEGWVISYFLFLFFISLSQKKKSIPFSTIALALSSIIVVMLTSRRGVWIVTAIGIIAAYFLGLGRIRFRNVLTLLLVILVSSAMLFFLTASLIEDSQSEIVDTLVYRFNKLIDLFNSDEDGYYSRGIMDARMTRYRGGLNYFLESPILGKGLGFQSDFLFAGSDGNFYYRQSTFHSAYLEILVSGGFVGLLLFLLIHLKFIAGILKIKNKINPIEKKYFIALFVVYLNGMIWSIVDNNFVSNSNFIFHIYFIMGVLAKYSDTLLEKYKRQKYDQLLVRQ